MISIRSILTVVGVVLATWFCWVTYNYFFDTIKPELVVTGIEPGGCYAGEIPCVLSGSKAADVSVWLDGKPVVQNFKIHKPNFENALPIPARSIPNGQHNLKIVAVDGSFNQNRACYECDFEIDNTPLQAAIVGVGTDNKVFQGRTLHVQLQSNKKLKSARAHTLTNVYDFVPEMSGSTVYEAFVPVPCEEDSNEYPLCIKVEDPAGNQIQLEDKFQIMAFPFKKQNLVVSDEKYKQEQELSNGDLLEDQIAQLTRQSPSQKLWRGPFYVPLDLDRITCEYGVQRTTRQRGRYAHRAIDLIGPYKCVVWAPHDGIVVVKDRFGLSGNTVVIDHGCGVLSLLFHLDSFADISVGDKIKRGNPVGIMGRTGYCAGDHLHWEMRVNDVPVDPMQWTKANF